MSRTSGLGALARAASAAGWLALLACGAGAQRLALRTFGIAEGLADSRVNDVREDSRGFVWIATWEGVSRFDGRRFVSYGTRDGLGALLVNAVTEDAGGRIWVATNGGGIARLDERPGRAVAFEGFALGGASANNVNEILFDDLGDPWCATDAGIHRGRWRGGTLEFELVAADAAREVNWWRAGTRARDALWFAAGSRILRVRGGAVLEGAAPRREPARSLVHLAVDPSGRLLAVYPDALFRSRAALPASAEDWERVELALEPGQDLRFALTGAGGDLWLATTRGLVRISDGLARTSTTASGLPDDFVRVLHEDSQGHLWIGTGRGGVARLDDPTLASFGATEGLVDLDVRALIATREHGIVGASGAGAPWRIVADRVERALGAGETRGRIALDGSGRWWLGLDDALATCAGTQPLACELVDVGPERGWRPGGVPQTPGVALDDAGHAWIARRDGGIVRGEHDGRVVEVVRDLHAPAARLAFDRDGTLWIAGSGPAEGREWLGRWRDGAFGELAPAPGLPEVAVRAFFRDSEGRMWLALRNRGVSVTSDPRSESPAFRNWSARDGLPSDEARAIAQDRHGAIWLGTGRGLVRLDLEGGLHETWTTAHGLAGDTVTALAFDEAGALWVGTSRGVTRFDPSAPRPEPERRVVVTRILVSGEELALPDRGVERLELPRLPSGRANVVAEFVALPPSPRPLAFEMRLEGTGGGWSAPSTDASVHLMHLSPGGYRLRVRVAGSERGEATVGFEVEPQLWARPWFVAAAAAVLGALAVLVHRLRVARAVALERIRRQIALDLHDDLGAGLAQIAIQTEVARRDVGPEPAARLGRIAELSRSLRSSMDDIVWSIDPRKDHASDLIARMRRAAAELGDGDAFAVELRVTGEGAERVELAPERRRHVFLIFKEALTNAARHSGARRIAIEVELDARELRLEVRDDGRGFAPSRDVEGRGLANLARRAAELGAELAIDSSPGRGARIRLAVPLRGSRTPHKRAVGGRAEVP